MFIDTNREQSDYQDDHYVDVKSTYSRLKQEKHELSATRQYRRKCKTWNWDLEIEYRAEIEHLNSAIAEEF